MKVEVKDLVNILLKSFAVNEEELKPQDPIELTIKVILSDQAHNQKSVESAMKNLKTQFSGWKEVFESPDWKVAMAIRDVGYSNRKTIYIKNFLKFVAKHNWDLSWIKNLSIDEAANVLSQIQKIPSREIRYILAFGFDMPAFPTDPHIKRVVRRIGILGNNATEEQISKYFESLKDIPHKRLYLALREHANLICMARKPKCLVCPVANYCYSVSPSVEYIQSRVNSKK
ncbi:MAG: hypothetical protein ABIL50_07835 [candidate division WOR-3 bacterium]